MAEKASTMVIRLSHEKLPETSSQAWVTTITRADRRATGWGANRPNGTSSWVAWLASTSARCRGLGRWWKNQLRGPGRGWVSWW